MRHAALVVILIFAPTAVADWAANLPVGSPFPEFVAKDQTSKEWTRSDLIGPNGLIIFVNRSTTW